MILQGDVLEQIEKIDDESINLCITSPPYADIKDYQIKNQIGYNQSLDEYFQNLNQVWKECFRVLKPGSRLCINIGDKYVQTTKDKPYHIIPLHSILINEINQNLKDFIYLGSIIWQKISNTNSSGGGAFMGSYPYPRNGIITYNFEYIAIFKKLGKSEIPKDKLKSKISIDEWKNYFSGIWNFSGEKQINHIAMFPEELPKRLIKMFSFVGDTIFDPFIGSGTTAVVAEKLGRKWIGIEINPNYVKIAIKQIEAVKLQLEKDKQISQQQKRI